MSWEDDFKRRIATFPEDPRKITGYVSADALTGDLHERRNVLAGVVVRPRALEGVAHVEVCADHTLAAVVRC